MKAYKRMGVCAIAFFMVLLASCGLGEKDKYPSGKDTIEAYGDGTFQLLRADPAMDESYKTLSFEKYNSVVIEHVDAVKKADGKIYFVGHDDSRHWTDQGTIDVHFTIYAVLVLKNNTMQYCAISNNPAAKAIYISGKDEMIASGDLTILEGLSEFSNEDQNVFKNMVAQGG